MPSIQPPSTVFVTGANGFIAIWVVKDLIERGYSVRGAVRDSRKAEHLHKLFGDKFESVIIPDITEPGAFDHALKDVDAICHTASPVTFSADDPEDLIRPAVNGTLGILNSALKYAPSLKRFVFLSSVAAIALPSVDGLLDETRWNEEAIADVKANGRKAAAISKYPASKALAEKAAWTFIHTHNPPWDLVSLNPTFVYGPILHEVAQPSNSNDNLKLNETMQNFADAVFQGAERPAGYQGGWVDVRDVSFAHVLALEKEEAKGKRIMLAAGMFVWQELYDIVNSLGVPGVSSPIGTPGSGKQVVFHRTFDTSNSRTILGLTYRSKEDLVKGTIPSLQEKGYRFALH